MIRITLAERAVSACLSCDLRVLIDCEQNMRDVLGELDPATIQRFNRNVIGLRYRTRKECKWRRIN